MKFGQRVVFVALIAASVSISGCALNPIKSASPAPIAERDLLADAAKEVEAASWPAPESASLISWITGAADKDRVTKEDAVAVYAASLEPEGARFPQLVADVSRKIERAEALRAIALQAAEAPRLSMNDVVVVENSIQTLRAHRDIYIDTARALERSGEPVAKPAVNAIRADFSRVIRDLSDAADELAARIEADHSSTYAAPDADAAGASSGL